MLLPPDLREWVAEDDMVHFVIASVEAMRLSTLKVNRRGSGSEQYPPRMMLALLIYGYANGIFSSRRIERATYRDVSVRYLTADTHPDHDTICAFRRENFEAVAQAFVEVLKLAKEMGVLRVGTVSVDGTHIGASASKDRNVRYDRAGELEAQLRLDIAQLMAQAERADATDGDDGQRLPGEIARREKLMEKMREAQRRLQEQAKAKADAERVEYERKLAEREKRLGIAKNHAPQPPDPTPDPQAQVNLTDPHSRLMRKTRRAAYTQSYNAQAVVDADGSMLILAGHVTNCASDANELIPALAAVDPQVGQVKAALADTGYVNADALQTLEAGGIDMYVAVSRQDNHDQRRYDFRPKPAADKPTRPIKDPRLLAMRDKLKTDEARKLYARRKQTVEPVFGIIKSVMGFTRFLLRGLKKVGGEWSLVRLAFNFKRLWRLQAAL